MNEIFNGYILYHSVSKSINRTVTTDDPEIVLTDSKIYDLKLTMALLCSLIVVLIRWYNFLSLK